MDFEQALVFELGAITGLEKKVFPLGAKEGTLPPFVIYISSEGEKTNTLNGYAADKEITCEIHVVGQNYSEMKNFTKAVLDKLQTFWGRPIGTNGPIIKRLTYTAPEESHEEELNYERSAFDITVRI